MSDHTPHDPGPGRPAGPDPFAIQPRSGWLSRRRDKIAAEIARNRRGEYRVPTWVLSAILIAILAFWAVVIIIL
jgi:hypothetical protein